MDTEKQESLSVMRGLMIGSAMSVIVWLLIGLQVWAAMLVFG